MKTIQLLLLSIFTFNVHAYFIPINQKVISEGSEVLRERNKTIRFNIKDLNFPTIENKRPILRSQNSMNEDGRFSLDLTKGHFFSLDMKEHNLRTSFKKGRDSLLISQDNFGTTNPEQARTDLLEKFKELADEDGNIAAELNIKLVKSVKDVFLPDGKCNLGVDEIATLTFDNELIFKDYRFGFTSGNSNFDLVLIENVFCE